MKSKMFLSFSFALPVLMAAATTISAQEPLYKKSWTTVGSAGTVDEADQNKVVYSGGIVAFVPEVVGTVWPPTTVALAPNLPLATVQALINYNVTAVDGLFEPGPKTCIETRFRDDGDRARVLLRLVEFNIFTGVTTTRLTFDSNTVFPEQANFQTNSASTNWIAFDFSQNAYYVEAVLTNQQPVVATLGSGPGLAIIKISRCGFIS